MTVQPVQSSIVAEYCNRRSLSPLQATLSKLLTYCVLSSDQLSLLPSAEQKISACDSHRQNLFSILSAHTIIGNFITIIIIIIIIIIFIIIVIIKIVSVFIFLVRFGTKLYSELNSMLVIICYVKLLIVNSGIMQFGNWHVLLHAATKTLSYMFANL